MKPEITRTARMMGALALFATIPAALPGATSAQAQRPVATVEMTDTLRYQPSSITVPAGGTVEWRNTSSVVHTVTADADRAASPADVALPPGAEPFNSGFIQPGRSWSHTFTVPGQYTYFCIPHEAAGMIGEVVVE